MKNFNTKQSAFWLLTILAAISIAAVLSFFNTPTALAILAAIILVGLSLKKIEYGIMMLAAYTPFEPFLLKFVPDELYLTVRYAGEVFMIVLLVILLLKRLKNRDLKFKRTPIDLALVAFILVAVISMIFRTVGPAYVGFLGLRQILRYVVLYYLIIYAEPAKPFVKKFLHIMLAIVFVEAIIGLAQAIIGGPADAWLLPGKRRGFPALDIPWQTQFWASGQCVFATFGRYDLLGIFMSFFALIGVGLAYEAKRKQRRQWLWLLVISLMPTLILTYSRLSWLGLIFGVLVIGVVLKRDRRLMIGLAALAMVITSYVSLFFVANNLNLQRITDQPKMAVAERILETFSLRSLKWGYRGYGRPYFIVNTVTRVVKRYPFFGVGPGQYGGGVAFALHLTDRYDEFRLPFGIQDAKGQIDNNWFSIWGETGTLGLVAYALILAALGRYSYVVWRHSQDPLTRGLALGYLGALTAVTFQNFLGPYFEARTLAVYLWLVGGLVVVLGEQELISVSRKSKVFNRISEIRVYEK